MTLRQALDRRRIGPAPFAIQVLGSEWAVVLLLLVVATALRFVGLGATPPGLWFDEAANGADALRVLEGSHPVFFEGNQGREPLFIYLVALSYRLFGAGVLSTRIVGAAFGVATVLVVYLLARDFFGRRVATIAGALVATGFWPLLLSRLALRAGVLPFFEVLAAWLLFRGIRRRCIACYGLAGLALGLSFYTYLAARAVPVWLLPFAAAAPLLAWRRGTGARAHLAGFLLLVVTAALVAYPLARYFVGHPDQFAGRIKAASLTAEVQTDLPSSALFENALKTAGMFVWQGDSNPRHNIPGRPAFDPLLSAGFVLGVGLALWRFRRVEHLLLLVWTAVMLGPGALAGEAPHYLRMVGTLPSAILLAANGLDLLLGWAKRLGRSGARTGAAVVGIAILASAALSGYDYFVRWTARPDVYTAYEGDVADATRLAARLSTSGPALVSVLPYYGEPLPTLLYPESRQISGAFPGMESLLIPKADSPYLYYVYPRSLTPGDGVQCQYLPCDQPAEVIDGPDGKPAVVAYRVARDRLAALRPSHGMVAQFGSFLRVLGYDLTTVARPGEKFRLTLYSEVLGPLPSGGDWRLFAHLVPNGGQDNLSSDYADVSMSSWKTGDRLITWLDLPAPAGAPDGLYRLHLGLFDTRDLGRQPVFDGAGRPAGDLVMLGPLRVRSSDAQPTPAANSVDQVLEGGIRLRGYDLAPGPDASGQLSVRLQWQADRPIPANYTVFVQLLDGSGKLVAQHDSEPAQGALPTAVWSPGEVVVDEHRVEVPPDARGRSLRLIVGMYDLGTGKRLPIVGQGGDYLPLQEVIVR